MSDDATLRDGLVKADPAQLSSQPAAAATQDSADKSSKPADAAASSPGAAAPSATVQDTADREAAELGRLLIESGYTREKVNDLLAAPGALLSIQNTVRNNPQEFLNMLERADPQAAARFHESLAELYVERNKHKVADDTGSGKNAQVNALTAEVQSLREKVSQSETREQQREELKASAARQARYKARVDELIENDEVKKMQLTPAEKKNLRSRLDTEMAADPAAVQRINNGNFFDVPRKFKAIIEELAGDKKSAAETAKAERERASKAAAFDFSSGPNPIAVDPKTFADSWEQTEEAFAAGLEKFAQ